MHPHHDHGGLRSCRSQGRKLAQTRIAQYPLIDNDHGRPQPTEQPEHVREVGGRRQRFDSRLVVKQLPERSSHALMPSGDEDRDVGRFCLKGELRKHGVQHRPPAPVHHPGRGLNPRPYELLSLAPRTAPTPTRGLRQATDPAAGHARLRSSRLRWIWCHEHADRHLSPPRPPHAGVPGAGLRRRPRAGRPLPGRTVVVSAREDLEMARQVPALAKP
jgi:hypothetical protein